MKTTTAQMPATLAQKAIALLMALVLCMGLTPHAAWAEETGETGGSSAPQAVEQPTVTLTIVNGFGYSGPNALVNKAYSFTEGQTLAVFAGIGYATGLFGSAQPDERVTQQQAQEQSASASSTSVKQSTSDQSDNSQDGGDKASSAEDGKAKDENSSTDSSQEPSEGSSSEQTSQSDASSGGSGASGSATSNATENSGPASSSGSAPAYQEPEPEPAPAPAPSTISVYISIDSSGAQSYGLGGFSYGSAVVLPQGSMVYDALCATGASISGSSYYVSAINGLAEKQCGNGSGWTYAMNGSFPGKACGRYTLSGGESISWIYSTEKNPTMAM